jgi:hypothetical protein
VNDELRRSERSVGEGPSAQRAVLDSDFLAVAREEHDMLTGVGPAAYGMDADFAFGPWGMA